MRALVRTAVLLLAPAAITRSTVATWPVAAIIPITSSLPAIPRLAAIPGIGTTLCGGACALRRTRGLGAGHGTRGLTKSATIARTVPSIGTFAVLSLRTIALLAALRGSSFILRPLGAEAKSLQLAQVEFVEILGRIFLGGRVVHVVEASG